MNRGINCRQAVVFVCFRKTAVMIKTLPFFIVKKDIAFAKMIVVDDLRQAICDRNRIEQNAMRIHRHREFRTRQPDSDMLREARADTHQSGLMCYLIIRLW